MNAELIFKVKPKTVLEIDYITTIYIICIPVTYNATLAHGGNITMNGFFF